MSPTPRPEDRDRALALYRALGTYRRVADRLGVSERTVRHWAKVDGWRQRRQQEDQSPVLPPAPPPTGLPGSGDNLRIARMAKMKAVQAIAQERVRPQFGDLARIIMLEEELEAKFPPAPDRLHSMTTPEEVRAYARELLMTFVVETDPAELRREWEVAVGPGPLPREWDRPI